MPLSADLNTQNRKTDNDRYGRDRGERYDVASEEPARLDRGPTL